MGTVRFGTVGYGYRDWAGIFYPPGAPTRRQFNIYARHFDVCELTSFTHQMPEPERMAAFAAQVNTDLRLFVRIHNTFTHCADIGLALAVAKHFRKAVEPLLEHGKLAGLVGAFPYAFKNTPENREYLEALSSALFMSEASPLQLDFRHPSWFGRESLQFLADRRMGMVCVDEPALPGLVPPLAAATASRVLVRLHGRNAEGWWSGNPATRYDYSYGEDELDELRRRYEPLLESSADVSFIFQNNWQAQSVMNARRLRELVTQPRTETYVAAALPGSMPAAAPCVGGFEAPGCDDDVSRPPMSLPFSEVKSRVSQAFSSIQESFELPQRESQ